MSIHNWGSNFGDEQYTATFKAIVKKSFEKTQSPMIIGEFISTLVKLGAFPADHAINFLDIASDDGATMEKIIRYSEGIRKINLYAIDYKAEAIDKVKSRYEDAFPSGTFVKLSNAVVGNAFSGNLTVDVGMKTRDIHIAVVSHLMYGVDRSEVEILMKDIMENILSPKGVAILLHVKDGSDSLVYLRNKYGSRAERDVSVSEDKIVDPSFAISDAVVQNGGEICEIEYTTRTYFDFMTDKDWQDIKDPENFNKFAENSEILDNILRLSFIPLRTPQDMAEDINGRTWSSYINEAKQIIQANQSDNGEEYLEDTISFQIVLPNDFRLGFENKVNEASNLVSGKLEEINSRAEREFFER